MACAPTLFNNKKHPEFAGTHYGNKRRSKSKKNMHGMTLFRAPKPKYLTPASSASLTAFAGSEHADQNLQRHDIMLRHLQDAQ